MNTTPFRCHDDDACAMGQNACPTPSICGCAAPACAVKVGTHKPADAVHQIEEPQAQQPEALRQAEWLRKWFGRDGEMAAALLERQHARIAELEKYESNLIAQRDHCEEVIDRMADAVLGKDRHEWTSNYDYMDAAQEVEDRIAELESQLEAIGAGGVEPLRKPVAAPQAVQATVPDGWKLVPVNPTAEMCKAANLSSTNRQRWADMLAAAPAHPAEVVPEPAAVAVAVAVADERAAFEAWAKSENMSIGSDCDGYIHANTAVASLAWQARAALAATQPAAQGMDAIRALIAQHSKELEHNHYAYFELAYTRRTGWMVWITDKPAFRESVLVNPDRKVLARGQGDTPEAACADALAAQAKQGGA